MTFLEIAVLLLATRNLVGIWRKNPLFGLWRSVLEQRDDAFGYWSSCINCLSFFTILVIGTYWGLAGLFPSSVPTCIRLPIYALAGAQVLSYLDLAENWLAEDLAHK